MDELGNDRPLVIRGNSGTTGNSAVVGNIITWDIIRHNIHRVLLVFSLAYSMQSQGFGNPACPGGSQTQ